MNLIYWFNIIVLFGTFLVSLRLFLLLFEVDSIVYEVLNPPSRMIIKTFLIMLTIGQLHAMEGDQMYEIHLHDLMRDIGMFGLLLFVNIYIIHTRAKENKLKKHNHHEEVH